MRDEKHTPEVGAWLKGREVRPVHSEDTVRRVAARLPQVRQRSRWWPFPVFHRKAQTPTSDIADYQPSPIPATNGHNPTVTGRTQSMFSPVKAITAGALVFALGGVMLIAQPFDQQGGSVPGAATEDEVAPNTEFTAEWGFENWGCCSIVEPASDPRFVGNVSASRATSAYPFPDFNLEVYSRALHVVNDEGAWRGVPIVVAFHPDEDGTQWTSTQTFIGEGDYAGSFAVVDIISTPGAGGGAELHGYIIEGEPPVIE